MAAAANGEPLEVELRTLIMQQSAMIDELRASNARELEKQKVALKNDILGSLVPLLKANSTNPEAPSDERRKRSTVRRRRPRPRSVGFGNNGDDDESDNLDHLASSLQASGFGSSPDAENTNTGHFGATATMDRSNESQATATDGYDGVLIRQSVEAKDTAQFVSVRGFGCRSSRFAQSSQPPPPAPVAAEFKANPLNQTGWRKSGSGSATTTQSGKRRPDGALSKKQGLKQVSTELGLNRTRADYAADAAAEGGSGDEEDSEEEEEKYGYKNALWLSKSRALLDAVKDDRAIKKLVNEQGKLWADLPTSEQPPPPDAMKDADKAGLGAATATPHSPQQAAKRAAVPQPRVGETPKSKGPRRHRRARAHKTSTSGGGGGGQGDEGGNDDDNDGGDHDDGELAGSSRHAPAPSKAGELAWENEIARNILNLYASKVKLEDGIEQAAIARANKAKEDQEEIRRGLKQPAYLTAMQPDDADGEDEEEGASGGSAAASVAAAPNPANSRSEGKAEKKTTTSSSSRKNDGGKAGSAALSTKEALTKANGEKVAKARAAAQAAQASHRGKVEVVLVKPRVTPSIWFMGSGAVTAEWTALQPGDDGQRLQATLDAMEEQLQYEQYVATVQAMLEANLRATVPDEVVGRLWRQLVVTSNAFASRCVDAKNFGTALTLITKASDLAGNGEVFDRRAMQELKAYVNDSFAYFYYRRGKYEAALHYAQKAMQVHALMEDWGHVAKVHLHSGCVLAKLKRKDEAIRCNAQVLRMVEDGRLEVGGVAPQKLCLVAVCYHNIAVEQLGLRLISEACVSAQNARRLARLCLSYSTRFLKYFEKTHQVALEELSGIASDKNNEEAGRLFRRLLNQL